MASPSKRCRRAAIYTRISSDPKHEGLGVRRQEADCRALAKRRKWEVAAVFTDNDLSAYNGKPRPGYLAMLDAVKAGDVDAVVAWHPDRLHRDLTELGQFITLIKATEAEVATVGAGDYNLATASGQSMAGMLGVWAQHESAHRSERIRRKSDEIAASGMPHGGSNRPFGYEDDRLTIKRSEARIVKQAAKRLLAGETLRSVAGDFNRRNVATVSGKPWTASGLKSLMLGPRLAGLRRHRGEIIGKAAWKPILDEQTWQRLRALLTDPARRKNRAARTYLLSGLVFCDRCGKKMVARARSGKRRYACVNDPGREGCGRMTITAEPLEEVVVGTLLALAEELDLSARLAANIDDQPRNAAVVEARMIELAEAWAAGDLTRPEWLAARAALDRQREALQAQEAESLRQHASAQRLANLSERWPVLTFDEQRASLKAALDRVMIRAAKLNRFDPERVSVEWRA